MATALTISASLAQIGEFSFILATLGVGLGILPAEGRDLILAGAIISIILNPLVFYSARAQARPWLEARFGSRTAAAETARQEPDLSPRRPALRQRCRLRTRHPSLPPASIDHIVLIGYGRVGTVVAEALKAAAAAVRPDRGRR